MTFVQILRCCNFIGSVSPLKIRRACQANFFHSKFCGRIVYNMRTAYFRHSEGEDKVYITVNFNELNILKTLNFERNILEKLVDFVKKLDSRLLSLCTKKKGKKMPDAKELLKLKTFLLLNNEEVSENLAFQDLFKNSFNGELKLRILDRDYDVILNSPVILSMSLPKNLKVGCHATPQNCKMQSADPDQAEYTWFKSLTPLKESTWKKCGEGYTYKIEEEDYKYYLKLSATPKLNEKVGPAYEIVSETPVEKFQNLEVIFSRHQYTKANTEWDVFRIVSYNILADIYVQTKEAKSQIFTFCDPLYLDYDYRKNLLNIELKGYNADILCMQEVERKFFSSNLMLYNKWGYEGLCHEKEGTREGSALLYNRNKFNLITANQYTFTKELLNNTLFSDIKSKLERNPKLIERLGNISSQIQVTVLECLSVSDNILVIGNVHFYFHPDADHIRLLQGITSLRILQNTVEEIKKMEPDKRISIVLCGDFNSTPECGFHTLLKDGSVDSNHIDWKSKEEEVIENVSCSHSMNMKSCYDYKILTNYIPTFKACIDYIYYQSDHLELKETVPVPGEDVLSVFSGIPSQLLPSDHVALIADLKFKDSKKK